MHYIYSFQNDDLRELVEEHALMNREFLLDYGGLELKDRAHNIQSDRMDVKSHYDVPTLEGMAGVVAPCRRVVGPGRTAN